MIRFFKCNDGHENFRGAWLEFEGAFFKDDFVTAREFSAAPFEKELDNLIRDVESAPLLTYRTDDNNALVRHGHLADVFSGQICFP